jgi:hypothetical protein
MFQLKSIDRLNTITVTYAIISLPGNVTAFSFQTSLDLLLHAHH